jgi:hypothetical protein
MRHWEKQRTSEFPGKYSTDSAGSSSVSDGPLALERETPRKKPPAPEADREKGAEPPHERILDGFESTIERAVADFLSGKERIATLKPRRNTVWFSVRPSSPGPPLGPKFAKELEVSHAQAHDVPADATCMAFNLRATLQFSE